MTTNRTAQTTGPTEIDFFANHASDTLRSIFADKITAGAWTAMHFGEDHPMAAAARDIAEAVKGQLALRGEAV